MLRLRAVKKSFIGHFEPILKNIDLDIKAGEFCIVIGSNGSGKSTLMRSISGEYAIDSGEILIDGKNIAMNNRSDYIATVTQDISKGTIAEMTLLENMILSDLRGKNASFSFYSKRREEILRVLKELNMNLEQYIDLPLRVLSGGQRQMIAILMAISSKPKILLLDEHTSALDPKTQSIIMDYSAINITKFNITSLMITHKLDDAINYGNRLIMLHQGNIVIDVSGKEKKNLKVSQLLQLFHKFEDIALKGGE